MTRSVQERFWEKVRKTDKCWVWTAGTNGNYGSLRIRGASGTWTHAFAHRLSVEFASGSPVPDGMVVDHLCRNTLCVRPEHLEVVRQAENVARGESNDWQRAKTHCPHGHAYSSVNTYYRPSKPNARQCRECRRIANRRQKQAARQARKAEAR